MIYSRRGLAHQLNILHCAYSLEKQANLTLKKKETLPLDKYTIYMRTTAHGKPLSCLMINLHEFNSGLIPAHFGQLATHFFVFKNETPKETTTKSNAVLMYAQASQHSDSTHACLAAMTSEKREIKRGRGVL